MAKKKNTWVKVLIIVSILSIVFLGGYLLSVLDEVNISNVLTEQSALEMVDGQRVVSYRLSSGPAFDNNEELGSVVVFYYNESGLSNPIKVIEANFFDSNDFIFEQIPVQPNKTFCAKIYRSGLDDDDDEGKYRLLDFIGWDDSNDRVVHYDEYKVMRGPISDGVYVTKDSSKTIYDYVGRNGIYFNEDFSDSKNKEGLEYFEDNILIWGRFYTPDGSNRGYGWGQYDTYEIYELCFNNNPLYPELENTSCWYNWKDFAVYTHETCLSTNFPNENIEEPSEPEEPTEPEEPAVSEEPEESEYPFWNKIKIFFINIWQWFTGLFKV